MFEAQIKHTEPETVAYITMRGAFDQIPSGFERLYGWVGHYGLQPVGMPQAIYLTIPGVGAVEDAEWELWAPIAGGAGKTEPGDDGIGVKRLEPETVASAIHTGPYEEIGPVYERLESWAVDEGYEVVGPPREIYHSPPETPPAETVTEIQMPVQRR